MSTSRLRCTPSGRALARFTASRLRRALAGAEAPVHPSDAAGSDAATLLYEQLASVIVRAGPTVVLIDDLHWADDESLAIIDGLAGRDGVSGFAVVATWNSASDGGAGRRPCSATRVEMLPLTDDDLASVGFPGGRRLTGGIPTLLMAAAEAHRNDGSISTATIDALVARTEAAGPLAHEVLVVLAATARPMPVYEIAYVLGLGSEIVVALIDSLVRSRLLVACDGLVELADDISRQVLAAVVGADRARSIRAVAGHLPGSAPALPAEAG